MDRQGIDWHGVSFPIQLWPGTEAGSGQVKFGETTTEFPNALELLRWLEGLGRSGAPSQGRPRSANTDTPSRPLIASEPKEHRQELNICWNLSALRKCTRATLLGLSLTASSLLGVAAAAGTTYSIFVGARRGAKPPCC